MPHKRTGVLRGVSFCVNMETRTQGPSDTNELWQCGYSGLALTNARMWKVASVGVTDEALLPCLFEIRYTFFIMSYCWYFKFLRWSFISQYLLTGIPTNNRKYRGQALVERSIGRGDLSQLLAQMHNSAMGASLERSTQASGCSAVRAWSRFGKCVGADLFCLEYTIYLIMSFVSFEAIREMA